MSWATHSLAVRTLAFALALLATTAPTWSQAQAVPSQPLASDPAPRPSVPETKHVHEVADHPDGRLFQPSGDPDRDFALMMRAHHQEGVDMANHEIANGKSTKLKMMARRIVKDQQREIAELDAWTRRHTLRLSRDK